MENSNYLGTEKVGSLLRKFAIPCIFSLIISCLYNIVDQIFVGNGVGYLGNAATGVIFPITVIGWGLSLLFGDGAAAALSVSLGRRETENIHKSVGNAVLGSFFSGVVVIAIAYLWGDGLLRLIGATDANVQMAYDYGVIVFAMMPLAMTQNTLASIIRADGSPKYAMMVRIWKELAHGDREQEPMSVIQPSHQGVIITIAREHGSAGKRIGQLAAQQLNIPCYYKELVAIAAQESGLAQEFISDINSDENAVMRELYLSTDPVKRAIIAQEKAICQIADAGSCVIIGRSADYVLRNNAGVVRIFIYASKDYREKKVMEMYGDSPEDARKSIIRSDAARAAYYKSVSGQEWGDPHGYELCIDASVGEDIAANLICDYVRRIAKE